MTRRTLLPVMATATLLGALAGWFGPQTTPAANAAGSDGLWNLPDATALERANASQVAATRSLTWVGEGGATDSGGGEASEWILLGVLPAQGAVLVQRAGTSEISRVKIGDTLPDGSRLVAVERDVALIARDGCRVRQYLYEQPAGQATPPECAVDAPAKEVLQP